MESWCFAPIKARVIRVVRLDSCGAAITGEDNLLVSDGFVSVAQSPQFEEGDEFLQRNGAGALIVNEKDGDRLKRVDLTITLCSVDPAVIELMAGADLITRDDVATGFTFGEDVNDEAYGLELWDFASGDACVDGEARHPYWVFPIVKHGKLGDITHEYGTQTWELTGSTKVTPTGYEHHSGLWLPGELDRKHYGFNQVTETPPEPACGYQELVIA